jgi:hypothetical protein
MYVCMYVCMLCFKLRMAQVILIKFNTNVVPLQAIPNSYPSRSH